MPSMNIIDWVRAHLAGGSLARAVRGLTRGGGGLASGPKNKDPLKDKIERTYHQWVAAKGDKTLRLDYDLSPESVVLDLGGFEGQWASDIFSMYLCKVHVFEPVKAHFETIARRFRQNPNIHVYSFGLAASNRIERIAVAGDASSIVRAQSEDSESIDIVAAGDFMDEHIRGTIDLIKINIEGAEYELLEHLIDRGITSRLKNIQVQFHDFVPQAAERMARIQERLRATHELTYQYLFIWENWRSKGAP